jgi:23S rRNA pseudouridine1911/1915/1917 synthase
MAIIHVDENFISMRLDVALSNHEEIQSRSEAKKLINAGNVLINHKPDFVKAKYILKVGDIISFDPFPEIKLELTPVPYPLDIVFEDDEILIVNKPVGMVVHPAPGHPNDTLVNYLLHHTQLSAVDTIRPGIVHRIDKDTSGLLVVAKDNKSHEFLAKQFFNHSIDRNYQAIIWGIPDRAEGIIDKPLGRHPVDRKKRAIVETGKSAITHWKLLETYNHLSLIECRLMTGRTHQIRVHLKSIGHGILGDQLYGKFRTFAQNYPDSIKNLLKAYPTQALHAKSLGFIHPRSQKWIEFNSELPDQLQSTITSLKEDVK